MKRNLKEVYNEVYSIDIEIEEKVIKYKGKDHTEKEWFNKINSFKKITENEILLQNSETKELPSTIYYFFRENVRKTSFLGLNLPLVLFLLFSFISFSVADILQYNGILGMFSIMLYFMGFIYFVIDLILLIKILKGEKAYQRIVKGQSRFHHISKQEYQRMIECFSKLMKDECFYIKEMWEKIDNNIIILREFKKTDIEPLYNIFKNPNVFKYLLNDELKSLEESKEYIRFCIDDYKKRGKYKLALIVNNRLIGYIGISRQDLSSTTCQIIYAIGEEYWHHGYVAMGLKLFIPYLKSIGMETIYCGHVKENINSGKVMMKVGFERIEERDSTMLIHGEEKEILAYVLKDNKENIY